MQTTVTLYVNRPTYTSFQLDPIDTAAFGITPFTRSMRRIINMFWRRQLLDELRGGEDHGTT